MKIARLLLSAFMFIMYLFALTKAAFGAEHIGDHNSISPRLLNVEMIEEMEELKHRCKDNRAFSEMMIEVLVDRRGVVVDYFFKKCQDQQFEQRLVDMINRLSFIPALSQEGIPKAGVYEIKLKGHHHS